MAKWKGSYQHQRYEILREHGACTSCGRSHATGEKLDVKALMGTARPKPEPQTDAEPKAKKTNGKNGNGKANGSNGNGSAK